MGLNRVPSRHLRVLLGVALFLTLCPRDASAWWNLSWQRRRKIYIQNGTVPATLTNAPVLVRLSDPARIDYSRTQSLGQDIRFLDADDVTQLNHEVERWNEGGVSWVWVKVPSIPASSNAKFIYMYYGNAAAAAPPLAWAQGTWDSQFMMVHHLEETAAAHLDSTNRAHDSSVISVAAPGQGRKAGFVTGTVDGVASGGADQFTNTHRVEIPDHNDLDIANNESFTVEAWIKTGYTGNFQEIVAKDWNAGPGTPAGWDFMIWGGNELRFNVYDDTFLPDPALPLSIATAQAGNVAGNGWHYVVGTWDNASSTASIYIDGTFVTSNTNAALAGSAFAGPNVVKIGEEADNSNGYNFGGALAGEEGQIDEVRISKVALAAPRSADWVQAQWLSMSDNYLVFDVPTSVELESFSAAAGDAAVDLSWTTASELHNLGFHLYRADSAEGPYVRITSSLIPGLGSSVTGRSYSFRDGGLVNGRTYHYLLEDLETTGGTERHGPVSATPAAAPSDPPCCGSPTDTSGGAGTSYGDPSSVTLREVERSPRHVVLELRTGGFRATSAEDGSVRLHVPGFESVSRPGEPSIPMRRAFVEAAAGRQVRLTSIQAFDELRFPGLRPVPQGVPEIGVSEEGSVYPTEKGSLEGRAFRGLFPNESARLVGTPFQGETKKAEVLLFPIRWDGTGLVLSRRLLVRLEFAGTEKGETSRGGSQGRQRVVRSSHTQSGVVAQITVKERGLYRVDYEDVFPAGRGPRGLAPSSLRLSRQGETVAYHLSGGVFGPGSSLYFLTEGASLNPYADAVYELETNTTGLAMEQRTVAPPPASTASVSEYLETVRREENYYYQSGLLEARDLWLWTLAIHPGANSVATVPFSAPRASPSSTPGRLHIELQGASDIPGVIDHHVVVRINGVFVGEATWDGMTEQVLDFSVPAGTFIKANSLSLENVGDTGASSSMVFLNRFHVSYPRQLRSVQGRLEGRFEATGLAEIQDASPSSVVLDTTATPQWISGASATASGLLLPVEAGRSYLVTSSVLRPTVKRLSPSTLRGPVNQADYLLLGPAAFLSAAQPLLDLRESQGLVTRAVSLEEVYEQFGHGEVSPQAIKEFLEYAYHFWAAPSVRYVLLLGDSTYDPKNYLGTGAKDWLPGFPVVTSYIQTVSDPGYASVNGSDLLPDLAIGRLPAGSLDEAQKMVQKVLAFEAGGGDFSGAAVLVADNADLAGDFEATADDIANTVLASRNPQKIYYSVEGANTHAKILQAFDDGASFMSYIGHGSTTNWATEGFFKIQDVPALHPQSQQPLLLTLNCLNGYFQFPGLNSLSEALLKAEGKGVVAAFSPSGLSVNDPAHIFHKAVLQQILSGNHERLGDAILAAQAAYAQTGAFPELLSIYHIFGDPALRIQ